jgi:hypothetical protein
VTEVTIRISSSQWHNLSQRSLASSWSFLVPCFAESERQELHEVPCLRLESWRLSPFLNLYTKPLALNISRTRSSKTERRKRSLKFVWIIHVRFLVVFEGNLKRSAHIFLTSISQIWRMSHLHGLLKGWPHSNHALERKCTDFHLQHLAASRDHAWPPFMWKEARGTHKPDGLLSRISPWCTVPIQDNVQPQ